MPCSKSVRWKIKSGCQYYGKIPHALALQINLWVDRALVWVPKLRASPAVWQIELSSLIFGKNVKNTPPTVWQKT